MTTTTKKTPKIPPKPGKDTIYVDVDDEITAIIEKVEAATAKVVALVLPKRATVLQSLVNMRLLKRNAEKAAKNVVLITTEDILLPLAGMVGLHVAKNLQSKPAIPSAPAGTAIKKSTEPELDKDSEDYADNDNVDDVDGEKPPTKLDYHRSIGELAASHAGDESDAIDLEDEDAEQDKPKSAKTKAPKDKKLKIPNFDRFRLMLGLGGLGLILLIVFIVLALFVLPKAKITITTESTPVSASLNLNASDSVKTLDEAGNNIPAVLETKQQTSTQQVPATGQQNNGTKATGSVTMTNCSNGPVTVAAGTGVSSNGLTFITQITLNLDSGNFDSHGNCKSSGSHVGSTNVSAQSNGAKYNLNGANFTVAGYSGLTASGSTSGGTDNIITVVSQADLDGASNKITTTDTDNFSKTFESELTSKGLYLLTSTLKLSNPATTASPAVGQQATTTTVTTQITYTVLALQKSDLTKAVTDALNKQLDKGKQKLSTTDVLKGATVAVQSQPSPSSAALRIQESTTAVPTLDIASIKKQSAGQKVGDIKSAINGLPGVKSVNVDLSPFWVSKAPKVSKITVVQQQVKNSGR